MITPRRVYSKLLRRFGPQGWWPVTPHGALRPIYRPGRFEPPGPKAAFEICVGAVLTQNTAWSNAEKAVAELNRARALSIEGILAVPRPRLERLIRSSGYFSQKALKLKALARFAKEISGGLAARLRRAPLGPLRAELLKVHGVGPETADSILLYAGARPAFVVDAYTKRVGARLGWYREDARYDEVRGFLAGTLPSSVRLYNELHALFVALGKDHCRKKPACRGCPLLTECPTGKKETL